MVCSQALVARKQLMYICIILPGHGCCSIRYNRSHLFLWSLYNVILSLFPSLYIRPTTPHSPFSLLFLIYFRGRNQFQSVTPYCLGSWCTPLMIFVSPIELEIPWAKSGCPGACFMLKRPEIFIHCLGLVAVAIVTPACSGCAERGSLQGMS